MKYLCLFLTVFFLLTACQSDEDPGIPMVAESFLSGDIDPVSLRQKSLKRLGQLVDQHRDSLSSPRSWDARQHLLISDPAHVWTVGFYVGSLWLAHQASGEVQWKKEAQRFTPMLASQALNTRTHDLGFMLYSSLGKADSAGIRDYAPVLMQASQSLRSRYSPELGAMRSQDSESEDDFVVIIDNLLNLELLCWAARESQDSSWLDVVHAHARFTAQHFVRKEEKETCPVYHKIVFDARDERRKRIVAGQGHAPSSVWSRGQAWGIYGYAMLYRWTGESDYLQLARCLADYWIAEVPADGVPYWDFEAPTLPLAARDASAAAIAASALLDLCTALPDAQARPFFQQALLTLKSLSSPTYFLPEGKPFILDHSTLSYPGRIDIDAPQSMADYYFLEALARYEQVYKKFEG